MNKTKTDQALIDRYVYDVIRRLPRGQREDIELEIRSLIDDIWEESPQKDTSDILKSLGPPAQLAKKYRGDEFNYVIGPESCDSYWTIAKIISGCILIGVLVSSVIQMLKDTPASAGGFLSSIAGRLSSCLTAGFCAFGFLTAVYVVLERRKIKLDFDSLNCWEPSSLPLVPDKKGLIKRGETITSIVFLLIFMSLLLLTPELFGAWHMEGSRTQSIPALNLSIWNQITPFLILFFGISLLDEIIKLAAGRHCPAVAVSSVLCSLASLCIAMIILRGFPFWNPDFVTGLEQAFSKQITSTQDILYYWNTPLISNIILIIMVFSAVLESGTTVYKAIRYSLHPQNAPISFSKE